jgi:hypothetical protein
MVQVVNELIGISIVVSPIVILSVLLNDRDRRESKLRSNVLEQVNSRNLRGLVAIETRCALFLRRSVIKVDMWGCSDKQIWEIIRRLSLGLSQVVQEKTLLRFSMKTPWTMMAKLSPLRAEPIGYGRTPHRGVFAQLESRILELARCSGQT